MISSCKTLTVLLLLFLFATIATTQQPAKPSSPASEKELKLQSQRLQAISMIKLSAGEAPLWDNKKGSVRALADAADLLWDENPGQGAKWLNKAWDLVEQVSDAPMDEKMKEYVSHSARSDLRAVVLRVTRKHDPKLADKFLKQLSQKPWDEKKEHGAFDARTPRSEQLLVLALQAVDTEPGLAFSLAEASLADGISNGLQNVLTGLHKTNIPLANQLFDLALARFSSTQPDPAEAEVLTGYLFYPGMSFSTNSAGQTLIMNMPSMQSPAVAPSEPQRTRSFLVALYQNLLSRPLATETPEDKQRAQKTLVVGSWVSRQYKTYAPDVAPAALAFLAQLRSQISPASDASNSNASNSRTKTSEETTKRLTQDELFDKYIDDLEEEADQEANPALKKAAYVKAAAATRHEDYQRGKRIAEKIDDDELRADTISFLIYRAALRYLEVAYPDKAGELLPQISSGPRRAVVKIALAQALLKPSNPAKSETDEMNLTQQKAFDLLSDIDRDLRKDESTARGAKILLGRTVVLAKLDKGQALTALEQAIQMINRIDKFDLLDRSAPDLGLTGFPKATATLDTPRIGFDFRSAIEPLITTDFEQVAAAIERFTNKEVAGIGRIETAKLFLQKNPNASKENREKTK
jgi:hypothetical protein